MRETLRIFEASRRTQLDAVRRALVSVPTLLWQADARLSLSLVLLQAAQTVVPLLQLWIAKLIIDRLVTALGSSHSPGASQAILWLVGLELGVAVLGVGLREVVAYQRQILAERLTGHVSGRILAHAQELDLETLERPDFYDHLRRAEESAFYRPAGLLFQLLNVLQGSITLVVAALLLARLQPLALPLLLAAAIPYGLVQSSAATQFYTLSMGQTPATREARYLSHLLSTDAGAKEIRVFGLAGYLLGRYREILHTHERQLARLAWRRGWRSALAALLPAAVYAAVLAYLALQALDRHITIGDLTLYIGLVWRSQDALQQMMFSLSGMVENGLFLDDYRAFLALPGCEKPASCDVHPTMLIRRGIRFEGVTYSYPGSSRAALSDLALELRPGETVAIVGENGAGKTTLVKMLARLYHPDAGRITVDGRDIRELDLDLWRRQIAVIFQDYLQYYLTAAENIGFGDITALRDESRVVAAAQRSGAHAVIRDLPQGYDTRLGRWFDQGVQLSGGEWQRVALARALMRDAPILVLDEPTASLDARAELEIFQHLRDLTRDRTVLLISHRFSTVRMADRIYVVDAGHVLEAGSHDDLLCRGGRYAELFHLQAAGYR